MKINGFNVKKSGNLIICENGISESVETIKEIIYAYNKYDKFFYTEKKDIILKKKHKLFGMVLTVEDIININYLI